MHRLTFLVGVGVGYVLGARAGRKRYDQIMSIAHRVAQDPTVQRTASAVQDGVRHQASGIAHDLSGRVPGLRSRVQHTAAHDGAPYPG